LQFLRYGFPFTLCRGTFPMKTITSNEADQETEPTEPDRKPIYYYMRLTLAMFISATFLFKKGYIDVTEP